MIRSTFAVVVAAILVVSALAFGASAFTAAEVNREATIDVVSDSNGPLQFGSGGTGITEIDSGGELSIDVSLLGGSTGINPNASYTFGSADADDAASVSASDYVFSINNTDTTDHSISLSYTPDDGSVTANNVVFEVYKMGDGTENGPYATVKADGTATSFTANSSTTYHVVATFDTGVDGSDITDSGTLSGTFNATV